LIDNTDPSAAHSGAGAKKNSAIGPAIRQILIPVLLV
jgi:hypothetical protein